MRYHIHGTATFHQYKEPPVTGDVTVSVDADSEEQAQAMAWKLCPHLDVDEIEEAA